MSIPLGTNLRIRAMVYVAAEPVPYFWPMRSFIHHNPLHGFEHLPFEQAVEKGTRLFKARGFLPRSAYRRYLDEGQVDIQTLQQQVERLVASQDITLPLDLGAWLMADLTRLDATAFQPLTATPPEQVHAVLHGEKAALPDITEQTVGSELAGRLLDERPLYETFDALHGTSVGSDLDEQVIRACLDFFDEGQSVWSMPNREQGFFRTWLAVAGNAVQQTLAELAGGDQAAAKLAPEEVIALVLRHLQIPEGECVDYFTRELTRLHGWSGFIRWRSNTPSYHWQQRYPGDLVDYLAVRLLLALTLLQQQAGGQRPYTLQALRDAITARPYALYLQLELNSQDGLIAMARDIEQTLQRGKADKIEQLFHEYRSRKLALEARRQADGLIRLAECVDDKASLLQLSREQLAQLLELLQAFHRQEGLLWLKAMEAKATDRLFDGLSLLPPPPSEKRPFAEALFCIDTRSERIRRHLESVGDYNTYGIAGFFGVPVSFMELGKGSESHLCPVLLTPKNLVIEVSAIGVQDAAAVTALEKAMHELKESVLTPFVTVEAIGLLFGFDMIGKTLLPSHYNRWRARLHDHKPATRLMLDKLDRKQADSIVRAVQRAVIVKAVEQEFQLESETITDSIVRELREAALEHQVRCPEFAASLDLDDAEVDRFVARLRNAYRINQGFAQLQMERLGRIGFSLEEQARFVAQALQSIGLTRDFSRFILLVGHGSSSENNPYESALDCGACGGAHGTVSARVLAQMANKPEVRQRLRGAGIEIPDDAWFVPALHNTTTDEITLHDLELLPPSHLVYLDRLRDGLNAASRLCAQERLPSLQDQSRELKPAAAFRHAQRNAVDWSQVRPEWGLSRNAYFVIGRRSLTRSKMLDGRAFLHSYDYRVDPKRRLLENILTGPLVVGQWINMEHYFSTVDNEKFGSGSKVYHNVAGRFGVLSGNLSDLRTGLPAQTVLDNGHPYHQPMRLITVIEAPLEHARQAIESVVAVKRLVRNGWIRLLVIDPETSTICQYDDGEWISRDFIEADQAEDSHFQEARSA